MSNAEKIIASNFDEAIKHLQCFNNSENTALIAKASTIMADAIRSGGKIISCGNGGSMCDAMHFAEELSGRFRNNRKALPAISISDPSHITCVGNDFGFDSIFSRFIEAMGKPNDVLLAISTSGNSVNVINAIDAALKLNMTVIGLTGKDGGNMAAKCHVEIRAPFSTFADRAQEIHIKVIHSLIQCIENILIS
jgi:D-sedoheptulose 7-phosphate isomerase